MSENLVEIKKLRKEFSVRSGAFGADAQALVAVNDVSLSIAKGETLGLVGESGCGKTTLGRAILRLIEPTSGAVYFDGEDVRALHGKKLRSLRRRLQIVFQDPFASLNPRMRVKTLVGDGLTIHGLAKGREYTERVAEILKKVGLRADDMDKYPHQFSGGQRQRIGIARALVLNPDFIVLDEPVSALDVSIQAQIVNLLADLRSSMGLTYLFIAHDLSVVEHISTRVAVMYLGRIVELTSAENLYSRPAHPYTRLLLSSVPVPDPTHVRKGASRQDDEVPSPMNVPSGCPFHPRCPYVVEQCRRELPELRTINSEKKHHCACHRAEEVQKGALS